jgi:hypothetical protein
MTAGTSTMSDCTQASTEGLEKRTWVYVQRPASYEMAACKCGNADPDWSEYKGRLWCAKCETDFVPEHNGVFDGPIPLMTAQMLGMSFDRYMLATGQIESGI